MTPAQAAAPAGEGPDTVYIFYSSRAQPDIVDAYADAITYLKETAAELHVVDIDEDPEPARDHGIMSTPAVVVEHGDEEDTYLGITTGLTEVLKGDVYGRSVLYETGFSAGRQQARDHGLAGDADQDTVSSALSAMLGHEGRSTAIESYDPDAPAATVSIRPQDGEAPPDPGIVHEQLGAFLGGVFTEVFDRPIAAEEVACARQEADHCRFELRPDSDTEQA